MGMAEIVNIFNFLKEFNELSNPVITEIANQKWSMNFSDIPRIDEIRCVFQGHEIGETDYLKVNKPTLSPCPKPQEFLLEWIKNDWKKLTIEEIEVSDTLPRQLPDADGNYTYIEESFDDDTTRVEAYQVWLSERNKWRETELPKSEGLELYNRLFQLYSEMKLESESVELILGDGNIRWNTPERIIDHPVLLQKVQLHFDAEIPSFKVYTDEKKSELYTPMLRVISSINQKMLSEIIGEIEEHNYDISQIVNTQSLFKRILNVVDTNGEYTHQRNPIKATATMYSAPILFLRKRTLGYSSFIEGVIKGINEEPSAELPRYLNVMSGIYPEESQEVIEEKSWNHSGIDEDVLLTLPANNEQLRIIKYLDRYGAVLVQGPPGTGKTHTIANLIGHLLSQGNSVLVTSHTEKALTVLKEKVYRDPHDPELNLQNLCISLLSSTSQKKEMDEAINEIASKSSSVDLHGAELKIGQLTTERKKLVDRSRKLTADLIRARSTEYKDILYDNHTITPIEAAKFLNSGKGEYDYITGKSNQDEMGFPLTHEELVYLYATNDQLNHDEEQLLTKSYPPSEQIKPSNAFAAIVDQMNDIQARLSEKADLGEAQIELPLEIIYQQLNEIEKMNSTIKSFEPLEEALINKTIIDPTYSKLWEDVLIRADAILTKHEDIRKLKLNDDFTIDESALSKTALQTLQNIVDTGKEKPIGLFAKGEWKRLRDVIKLNGKSIEYRDAFIKAYELISYEIEKQDVIKLVNKLLSDVIAIDNTTYDDFENGVRKYKDQIEAALTWYRKECEPLIAKIDKGIHWATERRLPRLTSIDRISLVMTYLLSICELFQAKIEEAQLVDLTNQITDYKSLLGEYSDTNPLIDKLLITVSELDKAAYNEHLKALNELIDKNEIAEKRYQLLSRIREIAPVLAKQIENREAIHSNSTIPDGFDNAWKYFQLKNQIERLDELNPQSIQLEIQKINAQLLKNAQMLAIEKAWYEKIKNQNAKQNQALQGWRNTVRQIGRGTGRNAPALRAKARELMPLCQSAIPVWIMPLNRVVETFTPGENKFDVIIIDEASQANILALAALYLAKKVIIVGDDEQVSPDVVGIKTDEINALIAQHLDGIPGNHLYNGLTSLYDMARSSGFKPLMLTEHFRCLPEIIGFSNDLSYNGRIKPLRDTSTTTVYPPVVEYRVTGGARNKNKVNEVEADHIVSLIQAFLEMEEYNGQTIGVISMLGNEQSAVIEKLLQALIDPIVYEERRIQCGTPPQFQGDERDIILLSLVDSPNENGGPLRLLREDGKNDIHRKRYNVAASRAKNQLWVVHSLHPENDLQPDDLRLKLIKYAMNPNREQDQLLSMSESPFEMEVMQYLLNKNYKVIPQYKVGAYRIDMVIQYGDKRVALECDGERFHTVDNLSDDLARQAILERLGWRFIRIRGSAYYRDPEQTMKQVIESLTKLGIHPSYEDGDSNNTINESLIAKVKARAASYRKDTNEIQEPSETEEHITPITSNVENIATMEHQMEIPMIRPKQMDIFTYTSADNTTITEAHESGSTQSLDTTNQFATNQRTENMPVNEENKPKYDFRCRNIEDQELDQESKKPEMTPNESSILKSPRFDYSKKM